MRPPFSIIVVCGDGERVRRLSLPRWIAYGAFTLAVAVPIGMAIFSNDYVSKDTGVVQQQHEQTAVRHAAYDAQREVMASVRKRIASVRNEIAAWKGVHARIWKSFGPEVTPDVPRNGVAGDTPDEQSAATSAPPDVGDEIRLLAVSVAEEDRRLYELEQVVSRTGKVMAALPLRWPVRGRVSSQYGTRLSPWSGVREHHKGIDIGSPAGTPVRSPGVATVLAAGAGGGYGRYVRLDHGNSVDSLYGHLREIDVKVGEQVSRGQIIGRVGSTGHSTGPHLHYEVHVEGKPVDPRKFLWNG